MARQATLYAEAAIEPFDPSQSLALQAILGRSTPNGVAREAFEARQRTVRRVLADPTLPDFVLIDASEHLCDQATCPIEADGRSLYADDNHLSRTGAVLARDMFDPALASVAADRRHLPEALPPAP